MAAGHRSEKRFPAESRKSPIVKTPLYIRYRNENHKALLLNTKKHFFKRKPFSKYKTKDLHLKYILSNIHYKQIKTTKKYRFKSKFFKGRSCSTKMFPIDRIAGKSVSYCTCSQKLVNKLDETTHDTYNVRFWFL